MEYADGAGIPVETCEIPCVDDDTCPPEQECKDITPGPGMVCMECGGKDDAVDDPAQCCDGLKAVTGCSPGSECAPGYFCTACGDGVCGKHETPWECPADCKDCSSLGMDNGTCTKSTIQFWSDEQRRTVAAELNGMSFQERAVAINASNWFGVVPGAAVVDLFPGSTLRRLSGVKLAPETLALVGVSSSSEPTKIADAFVANYGRLLFGLSPRPELSQTVRKLPITNGTAVVYQQSFGGVPVVNGTLGIEIDARGNIVSIGNETLPRIATATVPAISLDQAEAAIGEYLGGLQVVSAKHGLFIYAGKPDRLATRLVYEVAARDTETGHDLGAFQVNAMTGEVLERHGPEWLWPSRGSQCESTDDYHVRLLLVDKDYEDAYCKEDATGECTDENWSILASGFSPTNNWPLNELVAWDSGDWRQPNPEYAHRDPWDDVALKPIADLIEHQLWPWIEGTHSDCASALGTSAYPFNFGAKAKMGAETVGFTYPTYDVFQVDGAVDIGTFAHEFAHRSASIGMHTRPDVSPGWKRRAETPFG
ncbi:MAG: hypothetical protein PHU25_21580 [Deltaproteobacteria bacterium]|nr:hypothetical protein [Deltaproteobacteria bacterium]